MAYVPDSLDYDQLYAEGFAPWEDGHSWPPLAAMVPILCPPGGRVLDAGCGLGTQTIALAALGYDALGVDIATRAIESAHARAREEGSAARFLAANVLEDDLDGPYDLVFDRGCFTNATSPAMAREFATTIAGVLKPDGHWLLIVGRADNRDPATNKPDPRGYPRQTLTEVAAACEPMFEILGVRCERFGSNEMNDFLCWVLSMRKRDAD